MSDKRERRWLQIHLSTAIVLMFVGGGLIGLNSCYRTFDKKSKVIGWPEPYKEKELDSGDHWIDFYRIEPGTGELMFINDAISCIAIIITVGFLLEWRIRRRERIAMSDKSRRRFGQIHKRTAFVLMLITGAWLLLSIEYCSVMWSVIGINHELSAPNPISAILLFSILPLAFVEAGLVLLYSISELCERLIRRRETRKR